MQVIQQISFPDHHLYSERQLTKILKIAYENNALVVTTEKDHVKLSGDYKKIIYPVNIELHLSKDKELRSGLKRLVN